MPITSLRIFQILFVSEILTSITLLKYFSKSSKPLRAVEMNNSNHSSTGIISSCNINDDNYEANLRK